jgi:hypothetical protein
VIVCSYKEHSQGIASRVLPAIASGLLLLSNVAPGSFFVGLSPWTLCPACHPSDQALLNVVCMCTCLLMLIAIAGSTFAVAAVGLESVDITPQLQSIQTPEGFKDGAKAEVKKLQAADEAFEKSDTLARLRAQSEANKEKNKKAIQVGRRMAPMCAGAGFKQQGLTRQRRLCCEHGGMPNYVASCWLQAGLALHLTQQLPAVYY